MTSTMIRAKMFDEFGNEIDADIVPPGGRVTVPMQLRDSAVPGIAGILAEHRHPIADANAAAGTRQVAAMADHAARVQRHLNEMNGEARARQALVDRDPRAKAYAQSCEALQYGSTGGVR